MKKFNLSLVIAFMLCSQLLNAQDIFKQHGFTKEPLTLSNGNYNEFFNNDEVVLIGTALLNTTTNKVVAFVREETDTTYKAELSSRWLSIDPLAAKYSQVSPYVYCLNNPIIFVDPDGKEVFLALQGEAQSKALSKFMSTEQGRAFIGKYANAGQVIMGHKFDAAGEYAQRGIDLRIRTSSVQTMGNRQGLAITYLKNSKSGYLRLRDVGIDDVPSSQYKYETIIDLRAGETSEKSAFILGHEAFVHADNDAQQLIETHDKGEAAKYSSMGDFIKDINNADLDADQEHSDLKNDLVKTLLNYVKSLDLREKTDYYEKVYEKDKAKY